MVLDWLQVIDKAATVSWDVTCKDCGVDMTGGMHILTRSSNYWPFEEAWVYTDPKLKVHSLEHMPTALMNFL